MDDALTRITQRFIAGRYAAVIDEARAHPSAEARAWAARATQRLGRADEALDLARAALLEKNTPLSRLVLAEALMGAAKYSEARGHTRGATEHPARRLYAELCGLLGEAEEGMVHARLLLDEQEDPFERAQTEATLAACLHRAGRFSDARARWEAAIRGHVEVLGEEHPEVAALLDGLGATLRRLGLPQEALDLHQRALPLHERAFGAMHPAVAGNLHAQAQCQRRLGDFEGARQALDDALVVSTQVQGADHPDTLVTAFELGRLEVDCGLVAEGFERMSRAMSAALDQLGPNHPTSRAMKAWM